MKNRGFSLLELAVVVLILGLVTTLTWRFIAARLQQKEAVVTRSLLERADWALTGFVLSNHRLPCPSADANGLEDCATGHVGALPYRTLGMADARAGTIRYGVLRRSETVVDPEDPTPFDTPLPRDAVLTLAVDRFYPLVGFIGAFTPAAPALPTLTTKDNPLSGRTFVPVEAKNIPLGYANGIDFCYALRVAEDPSPDAGVTSANVHTNVNGSPRQLAYALALPGVLDANDAGGLFDTPLPPEFGASTAATTWLNDDRVRVVGPGVLWNRLGCGEAVSAIGHAQPNAATAAVMLYQALYDYEQVLEQALELANANITMASSGVVGAVGSIIDAVSAGLHAAGDSAKSAGGLAASSIGAAVLMGVAAAVVTVSAALALTTAVEVRNMTDQRYQFLQGLRDTAKGFAERLASNVATADAKGLYLGR
ncbi:MAG: type II secretion system GspH family protein [Candidatus Accumulibacter sp.]|jgi:prepilin-type N-terminal cleavage/methylation domain-containing protein|nr:type II secretion system GspH family protein [Accumulibacter sp.]